MEENITLKTILVALNEHSKQINGRLDKLENRVDTLEKNMNKGFDRLDKKFSGMRVELSETQETVDFVASKTIEHEKKIRELQGTKG